MECGVTTHVADTFGRWTGMCSSLTAGIAREADFTGHCDGLFCHHPRITPFTALATNVVDVGHTVAERAIHTRWRPSRG